MSMAGDERMESLIQEAYEQIPVYLRNGRDMNRKGRSRLVVWKITRYWNGIS